MSCVALHSSRVLCSFADKDTERVWTRQRVARLSGDVQRAAYRRLGRLHAAESLEDLAAIPGNRLEKLRGDRRGQHSIRVNKQWRICFRWTEAGPEDVQLVDYHD
jgi:proteic killer suppression protein